MESVLWKELSQAWEKLKNKSLELERRDSELKVASLGLEVANQEDEYTEAYLDRVRSIFQSEKDGLWRELQQRLLIRGD